MPVLTEGPLGFPQTDKQARALDAVLKALPKDDAFRYRKFAVGNATTEVSAGERADVSWISTESVDRSGDVVLAKGMNDSQYALNPIVTLQHAYHLPPAGRSLWRKRVGGGFGTAAGVKAKTVYPPRPADWTAGDWMPDVALSLVRSQLLNGKSIGFLPLKVHGPDEKELADNGWKGASLVIDEWMLLEYACVYLPCQQEAVVTDIAKSLPADIRTALALPEEVVDPKGAVNYEETPTAPKDRPWDADAARKRLEEWADGDHRKYRKGFAYVAGTGDTKADYKLPHHDVIDGKLHAVWKGVVAAYAAAHGARGGTDLGGDKDKVLAHLAKHYKQFGEEPPKELDIPYVSVATIEKRVLAALAVIDVERLAQKAIAESLDRARGRV